MRSYSLVLAAALAMNYLQAGTSNAEIDPYKAELASARRALAAARIEARLYRQVEYERNRRELNAAIQVSDEEVRTMRRQLRSYGQFNPWAYGQQPAFAYRNARLCLAEAEARRRLLIAERNNLARVHSGHLALLELNVAEARAQVVELEGGEVIELVAALPQ